MARTTDITRESIFAVCESLQAAGQKITADTVRKALGGGSFPIILPLLKEWREQAETKESPVSKIDIPAEAIQAVNQATAIIWKIATDHQAEAIQAFRSECQKVEQKLIFERDEAFQAVSLMDSELSVKDDLIEALTRKNEDFVKQINGLELQIQKEQLILSNEVEKYKTVKADFDALKKRFDSSESEVSRLTLLLAQHDYKLSLTQEVKTKSKPPVKPPVKPDLKPDLKVDKTN